MTIEHKDLTGANLHEPKGVATAAINTQYHSNGAGSGTWEKIQSKHLQGLTGDGGNVDHIVVSNGLGGFKLLSDIVYGAMTVTNNSVNMALTAVADTTFNTATQFSLVTGASAPWASENLFEVTFNTDRLIVPVTGVYEIDTYLNVGAFPSSSAKVAIRYRVNGSAFSSRKPTIKSAVVGDESQLVGFGLVQLNANDYVQLYVASDATGNLLIRDANVVLKLIKQTA